MDSDLTKYDAHARFVIAFKASEKRFCYVLKMLRSGCRGPYGLGKEKKRWWIRCLRMAYTLPCRCCLLVDDSEVSCWSTVQCFRLQPPGRLFFFYKSLKPTNALTYGRGTVASYFHHVDELSRHTHKDTSQFLETTPRSQAPQHLGNVPAVQSPSPPIDRISPRLFKLFWTLVRFVTSRASAGWHGRGFARSSTLIGCAACQSGRPKPEEKRLLARPINRNHLFFSRQRSEEIDHQITSIWEINLEFFLKTSWENLLVFWRALFT